MKTTKACFCASTAVLAGHAGGVLVSKDRTQFTTRRPAVLPLRTPRKARRDAMIGSSTAWTGAYACARVEHEAMEAVESASTEGEALASDSLPSASGSNGDVASATTRAILDDVAANPEYYLNVAGVLLGMTLSIIVLSATVVALDSLPIVPDLLRMIGLVYLFWFLTKFLFNSSARARLATELDEFVAGVRGGEFRVIQGGSATSSLSTPPEPGVAQPLSTSTATTTTASPSSPGEEKAH